MEIKKINDYDPLNEAILGNFWNAIKGLFKTMLNNVDQKLAGHVNEFTKKIQAKNKPAEIIKVYEDDLNWFKTTLKTNMTNAKDLVGTRNSLYDMSKIWYVTMLEVAGQLKNNAYKPNVIYKDSPYKKVFDYEKAEDFNKNLAANLNEVVKNIGKKAGLKEDQLKTLDNSNPEKKENKPAENQQKKEGNPDAAANNVKPQQQQQQQAGETLKQAGEKATKQVEGEKQNAGLVIGFKDFLFEAEQTGQNTPETTAQTKKQPENPKPAQGQNTTNQPAIDPAVLEKFKTEANTFFDTDIIDYGFNKIHEMSTKGGGDVADPDVEKIAKAMKGSNNLDSKKNLIKKITQLNNPGDLAKARDAVAKAFNIKDPQTEIGKF
jgi:hypothetical protein